MAHPNWALVHGVTAASHFACQAMQLRRILSYYKAPISPGQDNAETGS